jgi:hypothetical protein
MESEPEFFYKRSFYKRPFYKRSFYKRFTMTASHDTRLNNGRPVPLLPTEHGGCSKCMEIYLNEEIMENLWEL